MSDSPATTAVLDIAQLRQAEDTAAWVLEEAKRQGADGVEVNVSLSQGYSVNVRQGEVETVEFHRDRGVSVTVFRGQRKGHASSSDDNRDSLRDTIQAAASIAEYTGGDLRRLSGMELADLEGIPGVGRATAVRLFVFFTLALDLIGQAQDAARISGAFGRWGQLAPQAPFWPRRGWRCGVLWMRRFSTGLSPMWRGSTKRCAQRISRSRVVTSRMMDVFTKR